MTIRKILSTQCPEPAMTIRKISLDSLRLFVDAVSGSVPEITEANVRDLWKLCHEFKFIELAETVGDW
jgi:hypothetical protein